MGFKMGTPYFEAKKELEKNGVAVFSSNYCLYADMSRRVINIIERFSDEVEQYSIDEAFVRFEVDTDKLEEERERMLKLAEEIHTAVMKGTGIPVRVSIAETKTLAKIGSDYTKTLLKKKLLPCVCFWEHPIKETYMKELSVSKVWGIGRQWSKKLEATSIMNAWDLSRQNPANIRVRFNIVMERTVRELNGFSCIPLELVADARKSLVRSRMFSKKLTDPKYILQAVSSHLVRGAEKLRKEHLMAGHVSVHISTGRHAESVCYRYVSAQLPRPTNDTLILNQLAAKLFAQCFIANDCRGKAYQYSKAGVTFSNLISEEHQSNTLLTFEDIEKPQIMRALDMINRRFGKYSLVLASMGTPDKLKRVDKGDKKGVEWGMRREKMSPRYTTKWDEVLKVKLT
jgi:DNA polymerase V